MMFKTISGIAAAACTLCASAHAAVLQLSFEQTISDDTFNADPVPAGISGTEGLATFTDTVRLTFDTDALVREGDTYSGAITLTYGVFSATDQFTMTLRNLTFGDNNVVEIGLSFPFFTSGDVTIGFGGTSSLSFKEVVGVFQPDDLSSLASLPEFDVVIDFIAQNSSGSFGTDRVEDKTFRFESADPVPLPAAALLFGPTLVGAAFARRRLRPAAA